MFKKKVLEVIRQASLDTSKAQCNLLNVRRVKIVALLVYLSRLNVGDFFFVDIDPKPSGQYQQFTVNGRYANS